MPPQIPPVLIRPTLTLPLLILAILTAVPLSVPANAAEPTQSTRPAVRTGKERLSDKASDEQRIDGCKVPPSRRTRTRPTTCPWHVGS
jgi:hypothetical protein